MAKCKSWLCVGLSGSGKTFAVKELSKIKTLKKLPKYCVHTPTTDPCGGDFIPVLWSDVQLHKYKRSILLFEDLIKISKSMLKGLVDTLNVHKRHSNLQVFLITHSVKSNNLYSLLAFFDVFLFTKNVQNIMNWTWVCTYFSLDKSQRERGMLFFKDNTISGFAYLVLNVSQQSINIFRHSEFEKMYDFIYSNSPATSDSLPSSSHSNVNTPGSSSDDDEAEKRKALTTEGKYLLEPFRVSCPLAFPLFRFVITHLPVRFLNTNLNVGIQHSVGRKEIRRVNLVDYVTCVTSSTKKPSRRIKLLHDLMISTINIPKVYIVNSFFKKKKKKPKVSVEEEEEEEEEERSAAK